MSSQEGHSGGVAAGDQDGQLTVTKALAKVDINIDININQVDSDTSKTAGQLAYKTKTQSHC